VRALKSRPGAGSQRPHSFWRLLWEGGHTDEVWTLKLTHLENNKREGEGGKPWLEFTNALQVDRKRKGKTASRIVQTLEVAVPEDKGGEKTPEK